MILLAMAVSVTTMLSPANVPEIRVTPSGFMSPERCREWHKNMLGIEHTSIDHVSGQRLISVNYKCVIINSEEMAEELAKAIAKAKN